MRKPKWRWGVFLGAILLGAVTYGLIQGEWVQSWFVAAEEPPVAETDVQNPGWRPQVIRLEDSVPSRAWVDWERARSAHPDWPRLQDLEADIRLTQEVIAVSRKLVLEEASPASQAQQIVCYYERLIEIRENEAGKDIENQTQEVYKQVQTQLEQMKVTLDRQINKQASDLRERNEQILDSFRRQLEQYHHLRWVNTQIRSVEEREKSDFSHVERTIEVEVAREESRLQERYQIEMERIQSESMRQLAQERARLEAWAQLKINEFTHQVQESLEAYRQAMEAEKEAVLARRRLSGEGGTSPPDALERLELLLEERVKLLAQIDMDLRGTAEAVARQTGHVLAIGETSRGEELTQQVIAMMR